MQAYLNKIKPGIQYKIITIVIAMFFGIISLAQQATTYDEAIIYGDKKFATSSFMDAKAYYQQALKIKPDDKYANNRIAVIVEKMKTSMAAEDEYYDIIDYADELYDNNKLNDAITQYNKALKLLPNDEYTLNKVREIVELQTSERDKIEAFDKAMEAGKVYLADEEFDKAIASFSEAAGVFPEKESPVTELSNANKLKTEYEQKEERFNQKFEEAERYFLIKNYSEAINLFKEAEEIIPENEQAKQKIAQLIPLADKQKKYIRQIESADEYYINKDFISARKEYLYASELWPEKNYPADMIAKINDKLEGEKENLEKNYNNYIFGGDSLIGLEEYSLALGKYNLALNLKPNEPYPKSKLSDIEAIFEKRRKAAETNYTSLIASADSAFSAGSYNTAIDSYQTALEVKPDDEYPASQLIEIDKVLAQNAAKNKADQEYNNIIQQADNLYNTGNYDMAIKKYREAKVLKSMESYPQTKIDAITLILANAAKQKQIDDSYNELIIIAVKEFHEDKLKEARSLYVNAAELKPEENMPKLQITIIDSLIVVKENMAMTRQQFDSLVTEGDSHLENKEYELAIQKYDEALVLLPKEDQALQKKQSVQIIQNNIRKEAERKKSYDEAITKGDKLFDDGSFELARVEFEKAQSLMNDQEYPPNRLIDISKELERLEAEKEERYAQSIADADILFDQGRYEEALRKYQLAISIVPSEKYPQQRATECQGFIAERMKRLMAQYEIAITDADKLHDAKVYDRAIEAYRKAGTIKPDETYPGEMIYKIGKFIEENSIVDVIKSADTITKGSTGKFEFEPIKINVRKSNYIFIKARNIGDKPAKLIFSYGSDGSKNGGFVVQVIEGETYNDYIVRVGNQYKWFSEDNNWLIIYPENGDVEISMLRISKDN